MSLNVNRSRETSSISTSAALRETVYPVLEMRKI